MPKPKKIKGTYWMDFEDQLRAYLRGCGKTPQQIGSEADVDFSQIYRFLNGQTQLRSGTIAKLCGWLRIGLQPLKGSPASGIDAHDPVRRERDREAYQIAKRLVELFRPPVE